MVFGALKDEVLSGTSGYKLGESDIPVVGDNPARDILPLSSYSQVVKGLSPVEKVMLYCRKEDVDQARVIIKSLEKRRSTR